MKIKIYKTIILPVVLYSCALREEWTLKVENRILRRIYSCALREEWTLKVKNRILRRIFEPRRNANVGWRRLRSEELDCLYRSPYVVRVIKSRRLRLPGHVAKMEGKSSFKVLNR